MAGDVRLHRMRLVAATAEESEAARDVELAPALAGGRMDRRQTERRDASDADRHVAAALRAAADPWPGATTIDTSGSRVSALEQACAATHAFPFPANEARPWPGRPYGGRVTQATDPTTFSR